MWAYFALRAGWLKINVGTNLGPQIYMYLSALGKLRKAGLGVRAQEAQYTFIHQCQAKGLGWDHSQTYCLVFVLTFNDLLPYCMTTG